MGIVIVCADVLPCFVSCYILNTDFLVSVFTSYVEEVCYLSVSFHGKERKGKDTDIKRNALLQTARLDFC